MERFNYPSLAALYAEDAELMQLLAIEERGEARDDEREPD